MRQGAFVYRPGSTGTAGYWRRLALLALAVVLAACSVPVSEPTSVPPTLAPTSAPATPLPPTATPAAFPQTQRDALDREVTIAARPVRIVSLAPSVTESLFAIGAGAQVVGRTEFCNYPPEATSLPTIGGFSARSISIEAILALEPDLVMAGTRSQKDVVATLADAGLTVYTLAPATLADIQAGLLTLGEITGNVDGAEAVVADMQARIQAVTEKTNTLTAEARVRVYYEVANEPFTTATQATVIGELLALAGANNIFGELEGTYPEVSGEQIATLDPQAILGPSSRAEQLTADAMAARSGWATISAVQTGAVYVVDSDLISRPGPRVVDALEAIAALLYPTLFGSTLAQPRATGL